jgi:hypothetical protein
MSRPTHLLIRKKPARVVASTCHESGAVVQKLQYRVWELQNGGITFFFEEEGLLAIIFVS